MSLDKTVFLNNLFDNYEALLTDRQREVYRYYYHDDLSYQEIADLLGISRAGVYDTLKRTVAFLEDTENKLGFTQKYGKMLGELLDLNNPDINKILERYLGGNYE
ncbi:MAG: signal recognition particle [Erysipelothrix sp.]|nr:signal recognition particle [Erysipelothrix sp.]